MMKNWTNVQKIDKLSSVCNEIGQLIKLKYGNNDVQLWTIVTKDLLREFFGKECADEFVALEVKPFFMAVGNESVDNFQESYQKTLQKQQAYLCAKIKYLKDFGEDTFVQDAPLDSNTVLTQLELLMNRFYLVVKQLRQRHDNRSTLDVEDEYDVQDLFHALLKLFFDDVRQEEWTPSYAGSSCRIDFFLDDFEIAIEIKMTRKGLGNKEASEQLAIDKDHYRSHAKVKHLVCFVYDPDGRIKNPRGFEKDLKQPAPLKTDVYVRH